MSLCNDCRSHCRAPELCRNGTSIIGVVTSMSSRPLWMNGLLTHVGFVSFGLRLDMYLVIMKVIMCIRL
jgi:hypothetical protein